MTPAAPTALIADDEPHLRQHLRDVLAAVWPELQIVAECSNGIEAAEALARLAPQVAFLDIKMPGQTGLQAAQVAPANTRLVFVTAYDEFAVQAFERAAVDYLLKPASAERLAQTVARLKASLDAAPRDAEQMAQLLAALTQHIGGAAAGGKPAPLRWIRASRGDTIYQVAVDEVLYFQSDDKYTLVHTAQGEHVIRTTLAELLQSLDADRFWQIHRSTVVQVDRIHSAKRDGDGRVTLKLQGVDKPLSVSRQYQHLFKQM